MPGGKGQGTCAQDLFLEESLTQEQLDPKSVALFERCRIAELRTYLKDAIGRMDLSLAWLPPEPSHSKAGLQGLKTQIDELLERLRRMKLPRLEPAEAKAAMQQINQQSSQEWSYLRVGLDLDLDLQRSAHRHW